MSGFFRELGGFEFFTKPVDFNLLKTLLSELPSAADSGNSRLDRMTASHFAPIDPRIVRTSASGHEDPFSPFGLDGRYRFGQPTSVRTNVNARDAPFPAIRVAALEPRC